MQYVPCFCNMNFATTNFWACDDSLLCLAQSEPGSVNGLLCYTSLELLWLGNFVFKVVQKICAYWLHMGCTMWYTLMYVHHMCVLHMYRHTWLTCVSHNAPPCQKPETPNQSYRSSVLIPEWHHSLVTSSAVAAVLPLGNLSIYASVPIRVCRSLNTYQVILTDSKPHFWCKALR